MRRTLLLASVFSLTCASLLATPTAVLAQAGQSVAVVKDIRIQGNQRIEPQTILTYLNINQGSSFSQYEIDNALKSLYGTGFFADVRITRDGNTLVVNVKENPIVNRIAFEGNDKIEQKNLESELELKPRAIYTRTKIQNDVKRILDIYRRSGRFSAKVEPKLIPLDQNRVDVVFEITEGMVTTVEKIMFVGNEAFSDHDLEKVIKTERSRWYKFFTDDDKYDPDRLLYDQELLRRYYTSQGYADFRVKSAVAELTPKRDAFYITFTVEEGKVYKFGNISVDNTFKGASDEPLDKLVTTKTDKLYNSAQIEESIDALVKAMGDKGFAFVNVEPAIARNPDDTIDLTYKIKQGPRVYVERINITGNVRTQDRVIRREFRLAEGDPFSTSKLARSEQRINNLGYFEKVKINNEKGSAPDRTVINTDVQEKSTGEVSFGAGFSTTDGALADVGVRESNLLGKGQDLRLKFTLATKRQQYDIGFTEPYFLDREISAGFDLFKTKQDLRSESSFDRDTSGGRLRLGYALSETLQHSLNYTYQQTEITNVRDDASRYIKEQQGKTSSSSVGQALTWDARNNKFDPSSGYYLRLNQDFAGLGGDSKYIRHEVHASYYYPISKRWTLGIIGSGGYLYGMGDDILIQDRFFLGGRDLRGFENAGVGPRDSVTQDALGGNIYYTGTTEMTFPLGLPDDMGIRGALFGDMGSLWQTDAKGPEVVDNNSIRASFGVGLAWASPFGPIRIDFAFPVMKQEEDLTENFRFSFGTRF